MNVLHVVGKSVFSYSVIQDLWKLTQSSFTGPWHCCYIVSLGIYSWHLIPPPPLPFSPAIDITVAHCTTNDTRMLPTTLLHLSSMRLVLEKKKRIPTIHVEYRAINFMTPYIRSRNMRNEDCQFIRNTSALENLRCSRAILGAFILFFVNAKFPAYFPAKSVLPVKLWRSIIERK